MKCRCVNCGWLEVNPGGAMFCGYTDERTYENEYCLAWKDKDDPQTNADRIRQMTDEELADFLDRWELGDIDYSKTFCDLCDGQYDCHDDCLLDWLKSPVEAQDG